MAYLSPVIVTIAGEAVSLPKLTMRDLYEVAARIAIEDKAAIAKIKDENLKKSLLAGADAEQVSIDAGQIAGKAFTLAGTKAIWGVAESKRVARGGKLLSDAQRAALKAEAASADVEAANLDGFALLEATQDPQWLAQIAFQLVTTPKPKEPPANPPAGEDAPPAS